jgi:hypothetical protein
VLRKGPVEGVMGHAWGRCGVGGGRTGRGASGTGGGVDKYWDRIVGTQDLSSMSILRRMEAKSGAAVMVEEERMTMHQLMMHNSI